MKHRFLILIFSLFACAVNAQFPWELPMKPGVWDYPVKPGTEEWKNTKDRIKACQIPENILLSLSTEDLTELCLRYPFIDDFYYFNTIHQGIERLFDTFNGIRELYTREDVSKELLKHYQAKIQNISLLDKSTSRFERGLFIKSISVLEVLLSRCQSSNDVSKDNYREILQHLVAGYEKKIEYAEKFKGTGFQTNFFSRAHIIQKISEQSMEGLSSKDRNSVLYSGMANEQSVRLIDELSYQLTQKYHEK